MISNVGGGSTVMFQTPVDVVVPSLTLYVMVR